MGNVLDKFLNIMHMNDDDYDDEYDDYDNMDDGYDDEDDFDDIPAPVVRKKTFKKETAAKRETAVKKEVKPSVKSQAKPPVSSYKAPASSSSKIVPMKSAVKGRGEVCVLRPTVFEDSREISDVLLSGRAAVVNLEGIDLEIAQRIIDFISGSCYAMAGNIEKISNYIFIVTPESIEISGDLQEVISSGIRIPAFKSDF